MAPANARPSEGKKMCRVLALAQEGNCRSLSGMAPAAIERQEKPALHLDDMYLFGYTDPA